MAVFYFLPSIGSFTLNEFPIIYDNAEIKDCQQYRLILTSFAKSLQFLKHSIPDGLVPALLSPVIRHDSKGHS